MFSSKTVNDRTESIIHCHRYLSMYEDLPHFIVSKFNFFILKLCLLVCLLQWRV